MKKTNVVKATSVPSVNSPSPIGQYVPPKGWEEITGDEKIERMRDIIKNLLQTNNNLSQDIQFLRDVIFKHSHGENNKIMMEAPQYRNSGLGSGAMTTVNNSLASAKPFF